MVMRSKATAKKSGAKRKPVKKSPEALFHRDRLAWDPWLLCCWGALLTLGIIMVGSASVAVGESLEVGSTHFLRRHLMFVVLGTFLAMMLARVNMNMLEIGSQLLLLASFLLLALVWVPGLGHTVNGSTRWLDFGISKFQAVEAVKLMLIVYLAGYIVRHEAALRETFAGTFKPLFVTAVVGLLLLAQPDFGGAFLLLTVATLMVWLGGAKTLHLGSIVVLAAPLVALVATLAPYRLRRLKSFIDPWADPFADGFQLTQALIAVGRGEWLGVGLGGSVQKLFYLPEAHTDFIVAVLAEELGFLGLVLLLGLMGALVGRCLWVGLHALQAGMRFSGYCAYGIGLWFGLQAFICVGVNLGLLPTKGITFPFVSAGGSSILMCCAAVGLVLRISHDLHVRVPQPTRTRTPAPKGSKKAVAA